MEIKKQYYTTKEIAALINLTDNGAMYWIHKAGCKYNQYRRVVKLPRRAVCKVILLYRKSGYTKKSVNHEPVIKFKVMQGLGYGY